MSPVELAWEMAELEGCLDLDYSCAADAVKKIASPGYREVKAILASEEAEAWPKVKNPVGWGNLARRCC